MAHKKTETGPVHKAFYSNMCCLMQHAEPPEQLKKIVSEELLIECVNNIQTFHEVLHYLLMTWNKTLCAEKFKNCWPINDSKQKSQFHKDAFTIVQNIKTNHPEAHLPKISFAVFLQRGGDRFCSLMLGFSMFVMSYLLLQEEVPLLTHPLENLCDLQKLQEEIFLAHYHSESHRKLVTEFAEETNILKEIYRKKSDVLEVETNKVTEELRAVLSTLDVQDLDCGAVFQADNESALVEWRNRVDKKKEVMENLIQEVKIGNKKLKDCKHAAEIIMSPNKLPVIRASDIVPPITEDLASFLQMSKEEIRGKLLNNNQLSIQGLLDVGNIALGKICKEWEQQDMAALENALPKLRELADQRNKKGAELCEKAKHLEETYQMLLRQEDDLSREYDALRFHFVYPIVNKPLPSTLLKKVPCTPDLQFSSQPREGPIRPQTIPLKLYDGKDDMDLLIKAFKGQVSLLNTAKVSSMKDANCSHISKRSHSPVLLRPSLSQSIESDAPPPHKDVKLMSDRTMVYTPNLKHTMHQHLLHPSGQARLPRDYLSRVATANNAPPATKGFTVPVFSQSPNCSTVPVFSRSPNCSGAPLRDDSSFGDTDSDILDISANLNSSSDVELPLGERSLQEIAALAFSPCSPPVHQGVSLHSPLYVPAKRNKVTGILDTPVSSVRIVPASSTSGSSISPLLASGPSGGVQIKTERVDSIERIRERLHAFRNDNQVENKQQLKNSPVNSQTVNLPRVHIKLELDF